LNQLALICANLFTGQLITNQLLYQLSYEGVAVFLTLKVNKFNSLNNFIKVRKINRKKIIKEIT
jgi:hypothetical protein